MRTVDRQAYEAAATLNPDDLKQALAQGANPDYVERSENKNLLDAVVENLSISRREGQRQCIRMLLEHGATPRTAAPTQRRTRVLHTCCSNHWVSEVQFALECGADPNEISGNGKLPIEVIKNEATPDTVGVAKRLVLFGMDVPAGMENKHAVLQTPVIGEMLAHRAVLLNVAERGKLACEMFGGQDRQKKYNLDFLNAGYAAILLHPQCWHGGIQEMMRAYDTLLTPKAKARLDLSAVLRDYEIQRPGTHLAAYISMQGRAAKAL